MSSVKTETPMTMDEAFPSVDPGISPLGTRVVVQVMRTKASSSGGIILVAETRETEKWNQQTAKVISCGPLAFRNRETLLPWKEGVWVEAGDFVRVPRWNGDRIQVPVKDSDEPITFVVFNDHELIAKVTGDPLAVRTYIL
jgi:co-chaperonin GroES (HSP10)